MVPVEPLFVAAGRNASSGAGLLWPLNFQYIDNTEKEMALSSGGKV